MTIPAADFDIKSFSERLGVVINGESVNGFAKRCGMSEGMIRRYLEGGSVPSLDKAVAIAKAGKVSLVWLVTGKDTPMPEAQAAVEDANTQGLVTLPVVNLAYFLENEAQGRRGDRTIGYTKFDRAWLDAWYLDPDHICVIPAVGETVEPTIKGGEYILVTQAEEHLKPGDGLYVIRLDGDVLVKRLQRVPGGKLAITSDNPSYKPYEIALDGATDFAILGKVVLVHGVRRV